MYFGVYFGSQRGFVFCRGRTNSQLYCPRWYVRVIPGLGSGRIPGSGCLLSYEDKGGIKCHKSK